MLGDDGVMRPDGSFDALSHLVEVACGIPAVTLLITNYLRTALVPHPVPHASLVLVDLPLGFAFHHLEQVHHHRLPVIVVTHNRCPEYVEDLWAMQPTVLLASNSFLDDLVPAIAHAARGEQYRLTSGEPTRLTPAERLILSKVVRGWSTKEIAAVHGLQPKTVSNNITQLCDKLQLPDRTVATLYYWGQREYIR